MGIKIEMFIKLPYILRLEEEKNYIFNFNFSEFEIFQVEMIFNEYNDDISESISENIRIEAIYNEFAYDEYEYRHHTKGKIVELPLEKEKFLFQIIDKKLQEIFDFMRNKTKMFWIDNVPIHPISYCYGREIKYGFYSPDTNLVKSIQYTKCITDYYMKSGRMKNIEEINENTFNDFNYKYEYIDIATKYINKAEKALYERNYNDFIIYCGIATEAFIRKYIDSIAPKGDIVFNKISSLNFDYLDQYYNVLLKYLKGKSLKELDVRLYTNLKRMYTLRNAIMHTGTIGELALKKSGLSHLNDINFKECNNILNSIKRSFELINSL
ncbi:hypothetical protein [Clostridium perfringens]|uniref:hypothetical protein n=1 Tax=Clostridium perfringens TaxID=1502 RepID=UPI001A1D9F68|nr:hypothetical protein [Clostridium perfringens]MDK0574145.1 hypothetical protein [Clostridium perfringens]MDK0610408.1 hypothetical protein [Clostridium perfringens]MDM0758147.1 hypothetical protein [Clostridium perfringens]MDM0760070.1 hypothetical protein [Clostridium perfringens]MDM0995534.1 hypothetical protein [Clostridium perfringens]